MTKLSRKLQTQKRHRRLRRFLIGDATRPRLSVFRSNNHIYAQVIDDNAQTTIALKLIFFPPLTVFDTRLI